MTTPDELERVWRVVEAIPAINDLSAQYQNDMGIMHLTYHTQNRDTGHA